LAGAGDRRRATVSPRRSIRAITGRLVALVRRWREHDRVRRHVAVMTERELMDMGSCWSEISDHVNKPFWKAQGRRR
jgi:uncharacterized protein YjiS (DUF1127 family)